MAWRRIVTLTTATLLAACAQPAPNSEEACALVPRGAFSLAFVQGMPIAARAYAIPQGTAARNFRIPAMLDGQPVVATIDTGAANTLVDRRAALRLGVTEAALAADQGVAGHGVATADATIRVHRFNRLQIGAETATDPVLGVVDLPTQAGDLLIGMNYLRGRKLWLPLSSQRIDISVRQP